MTTSTPASHRRKGRTVRLRDLRDAKKPRRQQVRDGRFRSQTKEIAMGASTARSLKPALRVVAALLVAQAALAFLMVYPAYQPKPHSVPVGTVGSSPAENAFARYDGAFDVHTYTSAAAARDAMQHRHIYGTLVTENGKERLVVASAASPAVAQMLEDVLSPAQRAVPVKDIAPLSSDDPRGATINALVLPLISISLIAAVALGALRLPRRQLLAMLALFSLLGGIGVMSVVGLGLGALPGSFFALAGVMSLTILAISVGTAGLQAVLGKAGVPLAALVFLFIGSPASGNGTAPELLPNVWRQIGRYLPLGANGSSLRNTSYFDGNAVIKPLLVLSAYVLLGAGLVVVADVRGRRARMVSDGSVQAHADADDIAKAA
jgi:hypothetical protein